MNYLAHLHIADHAESSLLGNLLGDFVKGSPPEHLGMSINKGIYLHRRVDLFTDTHAISKESKRYFEPNFRRFVPIALDMFWDHCLAKHWADYHDSSLNQFVVTCQNKIEFEAKSIELPLSYVNFSDKLWSQEWLLSYQSFDNICYAIERISQRRPRLEGLTRCISGLAQNYDELSQQFSLFYPLVLEESRTFQSSLEIKPGSKK